MSKLQEYIVVKIDLERKSVLTQDNILKPIEPETAYLIESKTKPGEHERYVTDSKCRISKQSSSVTIIENKGVRSVQAGANVNVDDTDPFNPIVSVEDKLQSIQAGANINVDNTDPLNPIISTTGGDEVDTLETVMNRGNYAPKEIEFKDKNGDSAYIGYDKNTYTYYIGSYRPLPTITGSDNAFVGYGVGTSLTTGSDNVAIGNQAGRDLTTGNRNVHIGNYAGYTSKTATENVFIGYSTGGKQYEAQTGGINVAVGPDALAYLSSGTGNIGIGYKAGVALRSGNYNIIIGVQAGDVTTGVLPPAAGWNIGNHNVYIGRLSGINVPGVSNAGSSGYLVIHSSDAPSANPLILGHFTERYFKVNGALSVGPAYLQTADATYTKNIVAKPDGTFGWEDKQSLIETDTLDSVVQRGNFTLSTVSLGAESSKFGYIPTTNTRLIGASVGPNYTGKDNIIIGTTLPNITSSSENTVIGKDALANIIRTTNNLAIGTGALKFMDFGTTSDSYGSNYGFNFAIGDTSLEFCTSGRGNISIGGMSQPNGKTDGTVFFTGKHNVGIGIGTLNNATTATLNTVIGNGSASYITTGIGNVVIGQNSALGLKTGSNNLFIGNGSGGQTTNTTPDVSNKLCIEQKPYSISQTTFWDTRIAPYLTDYKEGLISGDFVTRELNINGKFSVTPNKMITSDPTFTKNIVAKPDGTFGWEDKVSVPKPPTTGTFSLVSTNGVMTWVAIP